MTIGVEKKKAQATAKPHATASLSKKAPTGCFLSSGTRLLLIIKNADTTHRTFKTKANASIIDRHLPAFLALLVSSFD